VDGQKGEKGDSILEDNLVSTTAPAFIDSFINTLVSGVQSWSALFL